MARGRKPDTAALQDLKGNPARRKRVPVSDLPAGGLRPSSKLTPAAQAVWRSLAPDLERVNFIRSTDAQLLSRYCQTVVMYWESQQAVRKGGTTYETESLHGKMRRINPDFVVQMRLEQSLVSMEDRLGLSPLARQQILLRLANTAQPSLPLSQTADAQKQPLSPDQPSPASPIGLLN